ncbi:MAG: hypothetical protein ACRD1H_02700, partial [Vicinamibacterales bacterium]
MRFAGLVLLLLNGAYLAAFATPTPFYVANVGLHMVLGLTLAIVFARDLMRSRFPVSGLAVAAWVLLGAGAASGLAIMFVGAAGRFRWLLPAHIALSLAGGIPLLVRGICAALRRSVGPERRALGAAALLVLIAGLVSTGKVLR